MLKINNCPVEITKFPDGTSKFTCTAFDASVAKNLSECTRDEQTIEITWLYDQDEELFLLQCAVDWLRSKGFQKLILCMPYVPNARMDRVSNGEMFTLKSFTTLINHMHFEQVETLDVHSNVSAALIDRICNQSPIEILQKLIEEDLSKENLVLFFPDEGAMKRYSPIANQFQLPYGFGMKDRDWQTGIIKGLKVLGNTEDLSGKTVLIVDDICSKGGTFYYSAKALKELGVKNIFLYVSHLENAVHKGQMIGSGLINKIYTTDSIYREECAPEENKKMVKILKYFC